MKNFIYRVNGEFASPVYLLKHSVMPKNDTLARRISLSPNWYYYKLTVALSFDKHQDKAETVENALKKQLDELTPIEQKRLLNIYDSMTDDERKRPKKIC